MVTIIALAAEHDWRAAAHYLERTDPKRWGRRDKLDVDGKVRHADKVAHVVKPDLKLLTDDELAVYEKVVAKLEASNGPDAEKLRSCGGNVH